MLAARVSAASAEASEDAVTISFVTERSLNGVRTVDVVHALQSDTIQDVKLRLRTRGHHVSHGHALVSIYPAIRVSNGTRPGFSVTGLAST